MNSRDEYRQFAAECLDLTRNMETGNERRLLIEMARVWIALADAVDLVSSPSTADPAQPAVQQQQPSVDGMSASEHSGTTNREPSGRRHVGEAALDKPRQGHPQPL
jgi:hypothetical protein